MNTFVSRYTGEVIYGSSTVPKRSSKWSVSSLDDTVDSVLTDPAKQKDSKEYKKLAGALKGKEMTAVMVERFGGKEAWNSFVAKLNLRILLQT